MATQTREPPRNGRLRELMQLVTDHPDALDDGMFVESAYEQIRSDCGGDGHDAAHELTRKYLKCASDRERLIAAFEELKEPPLSVAWILSRPLAYGNNGSHGKCVHVLPISQRATPIHLKVAENPLHENNGEPPEELPFQGLVDLGAGAFVASTRDAGWPELPLNGETVQVKGVDPGRFDGVGELEVVEGPGSAPPPGVYCPQSLAEQIKGKLDGGEIVTVSVEYGVARRIVETTEQHQDPMLQIIPVEEIDPIATMVWPADIHRQFQRDIRNTFKGRTVCVDLVGSTGTGKTQGVMRAAAEAARKKGAESVVLISLSPWNDPDASYIHHFGNACRRGIQLGANYVKDPRYQPVILLDEGDATLGQSNGHTHSHKQEEQLALQSLLSELPPGLPIYLARNPRPGIWLPAALQRRFDTRLMPMSTPGQIACVAAHYCVESAAQRLGVTCQAFGERLADSLFSKRRLLAYAVYDSGRRQPVYASHLQVVSPGKIKRLVERFCWDVEDGEVNSMDELIGILDREFQAPPDLRNNLYELTFLTPPSDDTLRIVELQ